MSRRIAISDIHGCFQTFKKLLETVIEFHRTDKLYLLGDYIDRGPQSCEVLEYIIGLKSSGFSVSPLLGNHEDMMLKAIQDEKNMEHWFSNGAEQTLESYGIPAAISYKHSSLSMIPRQHVDFLTSLPHYIRLQDYLLVHAGFNFQREDIFSDQRAMLWTRELRYIPSKAENKKIVHGHTPETLSILRKELSEPGNSRLNIDGGCVYINESGYGNLIALDLDSGKLFIQKNIDHNL